jgi:phosphate transport system substrate-binding protein
MSKLNRTVEVMVQWIACHKGVFSTIVLAVIIPLTVPEIRTHLLNLPTQEYPPKNSDKPIFTPVPQVKESSKTTIRLGGSTSMVKYSKRLALNAKNNSQDIVIDWSRRHDGTDDGIKKILSGELDVAASSRPLTNEEKEELVEIPIGIDKIVLVVSAYNPVYSLSREQVKQIFQCKITNWSQVGGKSEPIRVINRAENSGTRKSFKDAVLNGEKFCDDKDKVTTLTLDRTTIIIPMIARQGIGYGTYTHLNQRENNVKLLKIDGIAPSESSYPIKRDLFYVYKNPANPAVKKFMEYISSYQGRQIIESELKRNDEK